MVLAQLIEQGRQNLAAERAAQEAAKAEKEAREADLQAKDLEARIREVLGVEHSYSYEIYWVGSQPVAKIDGHEFVALDRIKGVLMLTALCECGERVYSENVFKHGADKVLAKLCERPPSKWTYRYTSTAHNFYHECDRRKLVMVDTRSGACRTLSASARNVNEGLREALALLGYKVEESL
jgi:hypothetical protein